MTTFAQTEHLTLRAFQDGDTDLILHLWNIQAVARTGWPTDYFAPQAPKAKEQFKKQAEDALCYVIITPRGSDDFVGYTTLHTTTASSRSASFAVALMPEYWGKGYGTEVTGWIVDWGFRQLGLHRIGLQVLDINVGAIALYKKLGFVEEGRIREARWLDGEWHDLISMGLLEREWKARQDQTRTLSRRVAP
ncbi:acyl-CoA N-acyltransferase [Punctularia strigosozonata HHB-11173 SS5]|uniref:acyl-CoA N-acyltransferase n=1 Tax=Punctularia strigosozonata (strain HHB-11173) TaxID=741275 RepID=UPI000441675C|nr:acyl-CoA N-acyltransferase [Punctularia strigosozonata HHB-11173 SS5]EIN12886.1 acyl-CoA N-acyltransferase [Punctularia strigosozonata HHB-11173 SS5]